jgi:uncharacterized protein
MTRPISARQFILVFALFLYTALCAAQTVTVPALTSPVYDATSTLTADEQSALVHEVRIFEDSTSNQIAIVMLPTVGEADIREFGIDLLKRNAIGQKGRDNGVLVLVAKDDKKISIEVGYGLEGVLPDAICDQIIRNEMRPRFREGDFFGGIALAVRSIEQATRGEYKGAGRKSKNGSGGFALILVVFVVGAMLMSMLRGGRRSSITGRGYRSSTWWWGGMGGGGFGGGGFGGGGFGGGGGGWSAGGGSFGGGGASGGW